MTSLGGNALIEHQTLLDQMTRWIMSEKQSDGSWGSTLDTTTVIRAITTLERSTGNIRNTDLIAGLTLDENTLESHTINAKNPLETFST